jgi:type III restriction enzyme
VIYSYPLASALKDGFVKEPAVATRENFRVENYDEAGLETIKLQDGIRVHEHTKVQLDIYARETGRSRWSSPSCWLWQRTRPMRRNC